MLETKDVLQNIKIEPLRLLVEKYEVEEEDASWIKIEPQRLLVEKYEVEEEDAPWEFAGIATGQNDKSERRICQDVQWFQCSEGNQHSTSVLHVPIPTEEHPYEYIESTESLCQHADGTDHPRIHTLGVGNIEPEGPAGVENMELKDPDLVRQYLKRDKLDRLDDPADVGYMKLEDPAHVGNMESKDPDLVRQHLKWVELDRLESFTLKQKNAMIAVDVSGSPCVRLPPHQQHIPILLHLLSQPHHLETLPGGDVHPLSTQHLVPQHSGTLVENGNMVTLQQQHPEIPGTPPNTPPASNSLPHYSLLEQHEPGQEPLELKPCNGDSAGLMGEDWQSTSMIAGSYCKLMAPEYMQPQPAETDTGPLNPRTPDGINSSTGHNTDSSMVGTDIILDDVALFSMSVMELNRRLRGFPSEEVVKFKVKRRTLKNRNYARNCRDRRLQKCHKLKMYNKTLQVELQRTRSIRANITKERDIYRKMYEQLISEGRSDEISSSGHSNSS